MANHWPRSGINHVAEYQASGHVLPVAASKTVNLNYIASSITATAEGGTGGLTFYDSVGQTGAISIKDGSSVRFTGKFKKFATAANTTALVELTNIRADDYTPPRFGILSGS
jgi:hypothetical protein